MRVLIVDDSKAVRNIIKKILGNMEYEILEAENGKQALDMLDKDDKGVDLILLDWNMPIMSGYEFLNTVKKNPQWQDIKVMMVTSENEQDNIIEALNAGADEYLMKPFDQDMLISKIDMLMEDI